MPDSAPISLKRLVFNASAWSLAGYGISMAIRLGSNLIMTRLLSPHMFGVMAIATIILIGLAMFSDLGLRQNIVQSRRGNDPAFLNTAWSIQILRGAVLWVFAAGTSLVLIVANRMGVVPPDSVYASPILPHVITVVSVGIIVGGFTSTKWSEANRNLSLGRITRIEIISQIVGLLCMLAWVYFDRSIWALVAGNLSATILRVSLSHLWLRGHSNRWHWDKLAVTEIFSFGKWIFVSSILGFLVSNSDRLLLGAMVDSNALGVYVIAFLIYSSVEQILVRIIGDVSFPTLSRIVRERPHDLSKSYYRLHAVISSIAYFCAGVLMISGQPLVGILYDSRYAQAGWMLEILAAALLTLPFQMAVQCFLALGKPKIYSNILAVRLATLVAAMPLGFHLAGLEGALWGLVICQFTTAAATVAYSVKIGFFHWQRELPPLLVFFLGIATGKILNLAVGFLHM